MISPSVSSLLKFLSVAACFKVVRCDVTSFRSDQPSLSAAASRRHRQRASDSLSSVFRPSPSRRASAIASAIPVSSEPTAGNQNLIVAAGTYVVNSFKKFADGSSQLWKNYQSAKDIRRRLGADERVSYSDFMLLQTGKEDKQKLMNLGFMMVFASEMLPYCFMFFPNMMPSTFAPDADPEEIAEHERRSRIRSHAVVETCLALESAVHKPPGMFAVFNIFQRGKAGKARERSASTVNRAALILEIAAREEEEDGEGGDAVLDLLGDVLVARNVEKVPKGKKTGPPRYLPPTKLQTRLGTIPKPIVKGLFKCEGLADPFFIMPSFMLRNNVVAHLNRINDADEFLVRKEIDLSGLSRRELIDACARRFIPAGPARSNGSMRDDLALWLRRSVDKKAQSKGKGKKQTSDVPMPIHELKIAAMLGYNAILTAKDSTSGSPLPRLLHGQ